METIVYPGRPPWEDDEEVMPNFLRMPLIRKPSKVAVVEAETNTEGDNNDAVTSANTNINANETEHAAVDDSVKYATGCSPYMVGLSVQVCVYIT